MRSSGYEFFDGRFIANRPKGIRIVFTVESGKVKIAVDLRKGGLYIQGGELFLEENFILNEKNKVIKEKVKDFIKDEEKKILETLEEKEEERRKNNFGVIIKPENESRLKDLLSDGQVRARVRGVDYIVGNLGSYPYR